MFTGIVETIGHIKNILIQDGCKHFIITTKKEFSDLTIGDSIAVNGVCLTVTDFTPTDFHVTAVPETLRLTNLNHLEIGHLVNLERSMRADTRLGGHYMQGHVDGMGEILEINHDQSSALLVKISIAENLAKYIVTKGYVGLDGMSITVIDVTANDFTITLIPHTQEVTTAHQYRLGTRINIEVDMMGKYIEKLLGAHLNAIRH